MKISFQFISLLALLFLMKDLSGQVKIDRVDPPHWWVNMKNDTLHLLVYGENLQTGSATCKNKGVSILSTRATTNGNYLFIDLLLKESTSGTIKLKIKTNENATSFDYLLKKRNNDGYIPLGLNQSDFIYLLMPDRFANGDPSNDELTELNQNSIHRDSLLERHGGDIQGIIDHLDYIEDLGITALWLNPVEFNDQPVESYHGYAVTDHFQIDPRLGTNELYKEFVSESHKKDIKVIRDVIFNHFGSEHELVKNLPDSSWVHHWDNYTKTTYRATVRLDPHASLKDKKIFSDGWFDHHMPDMNYKNKDLANYMIQNSIWWIEEFEIDAYRIDTYIYPDQDFMKEWAKQIKEEYPSLFLFAETWVHGSAIQAWFAGGNRLNQGETHLDGLTDFQLYYAINNSFDQNFGWNTGLSAIYYKLVEDYLYQNPENNVLFIDNHDLDRFYGHVNQDFNSFKIGIGLLLTLRGIPSLQYATEILMPYKGSHGLIRSDFPGGWDEDDENKFIAQGRDSLENEAFDYIQRLSKWRSTSSAITQGKLIQFIPENGRFVFGRVSDDEVVLVAINQNDNKTELHFKDYDEILLGNRNYHLPMEQKSYTKQKSHIILPHSIQIFSFKIGDNEMDQSINNKLD